MQYINYVTNIKYLCILLLYGIIAGSAFLFTSYSSQDIPPFTLCSLRLFIGCIGLSSLSFIIYKCKCFIFIKEKYFWIFGIIMGIFNNFIPYSLYPYSYYLGIDVGISSIFSGLTPLFALLFAIILLPKGREIFCNIFNFIGMFIGICGIIVISISEISEPSFSSLVFVGYLILILYVCSKAFASVFGNKYISYYPLIPLAAIQTFCGFICSAICSYFFDYWIPPNGFGQYYSFFFNTSWQTWIGVFYLGLGPSLLCYMFQFYLLKHIGSVKQITVDYITPIVGIIEGALFAGDWDNATPLFITGEIVGTFILLIGISFIQMGKSYSNKKDEKQENEEEMLIN